MGSEVVVERGLLGLFHEEGVVGVEGEIDSKDDQEISTNNGEDLGGCFVKGATRPPSQPEGKKQGADHNGEVKLKEREVGRVGKVVEKVGGEQALESSTETEVVGEFAKNGFAVVEGGGGDEGGQVAEMQGEDVGEVFGAAEEVVGSGGVKDRC